MRLRDALNFYQFRNEIERVFPETEIVLNYDKQAFRGRIDISRISDVVVAETASHSVSWVTPSLTQTIIVIPQMGASKSVSQDGRRSETWSAMAHAAFFPAGASGQTQLIDDCRIATTVLFDARRLIETAHAMAGPQVCRLNLEAEIVLPMQLGKISFFENLLAILKLVKDLQKHPVALENSLLDDLLYRQLVVLLNPGFFLATTQIHAQFSRSSRSIVELAEYLRFNLGQKITLTDMEKMTQLSARSLQYGFHKEYGCSPLAFLKNKRLEMAHARLRSGTGNCNITELSYELGFSSASAFSIAYKKMYGQSPSVTQIKD
jgi:AraC-like DNA-binding protein